MEEERTLAVVAVDLYRKFGRIADQLEEAAAVVAPDTAFCTPLPLNRVRHHQIYREQYPAIEDRGHQ